MARSQKMITYRFNANIELVTTGVFAGLWEVESAQTGKILGRFATQAEALAYITA